MIIRAVDLPPHVCHQLWRDLDSVEKLEVLRYAMSADAPWTTHDIAASLGLPEPDVAFATACLDQAGLVARHGYHYRRTPAGAFLGSALEVVYRSCAYHPLRVLLALDVLERQVASPAPVPPAPPAGEASQPRT